MLREQEHLRAESVLLILAVIAQFPRNIREVPARFPIGFREIIIYYSDGIRQIVV